MPEQITIDLVANLSQLSAGLKQAQSQIGAFGTAANTQITSFAKETNSRLTSISGSIRGFNSALGALGSAFAGGLILKGLFDIATGVDKVRLSMEEATGAAADLNKDFDVGKMTTWLKELSVSAAGGGFSMTQLSTAVQRFAATGRDGGESARLVNVAINVAARSGRDFETVVMALTRASSGNYIALGRLGIGLTSAHAKALGFNGAIEFLEKRTLGAAEIRAKSLTGQAGILGNSMFALKEQVAAALTPALSVAVGWLERLLEAWQKQPKAVKDLIVEAIAVVGVLTALGLLLGPLGLAVGSLARVFFALGAAMFTTVLPAIGATISAIAGPLINGIRALVAWLSLARTAWATAAVAEWAAMAPIGGIIVALAAVGIVIYEVIKNWDALGKAMSGFFRWEAGALRESIANYKSWGTVLRDMFYGVVMAIGGQYKAAGDMIGGALRTAAPMAYAQAEILGFNTANAIKTKLLALKDWVANTLLGLFKPGKLAYPSPKIPMPFLEEAPGAAAGKGAKDAAAKAATEAAKALIDAAKSAAEEFVRRFIDGVDRAKADLEKAKAFTEAYKATLPGGTPRNLAEAVELQRRMNVEAKAEEALRKSIAAQSDGEFRAAKGLEAVIARLPVKDKERVAHARELRLEAERHRTAAINLVAEYQRLGGELAKLKGEAGLMVPKINEAVDRATAAASAATASAGIRAQIEARRAAEESAKIAGTLTPIGEAVFAVQKAHLEAALDAIAVSLAKRQIELDKRYPGAVSPEEAARHTEELAAAQERLHVATDDETLAEQKRLAEENAARISLSESGKVLAGAFAELIPGVKVAADSFKITFSWQAILLEAIKHTKAYAEAQKLVEKIVLVIAKVLEALRPVIELLLKAVIFVTNGFISLWNILARLLRIFGIHLPILEKLSYDLNAVDQAAVPFIKITHDIPTLNELASGVISPLKPEITDAMSSAADQISSDADKNAGGIMGLLRDILGAIIALKLIEMLFGHGGGILGGIFGFLKKIFGLGGGGGGTVGPQEDTGIGAQSVGFLGKIWHALGTPLGGALAGMGIGALIGSLLGGGTHDIWGGLGGAIGGGLGAAGLLGFLGLAGGPLGGILGGLFGGLLGGLFGKAAPTAALNPDIMAQGYGQWMANFQGPMTAGGQQYAPQGPQVVYALAQALQGMGGHLSSYSSGIQALYAQFRALSGGLLTASSLGIAGLHQGIFTLGSGAKIPWQQYQNLVNQFMQAMGIAGQQFGQNLLGSAQNVRGNVSAAGNELATSVQKSTAAFTKAVETSVGRIVDGLKPIMKPPPGTTMQGSPIIHQTNHFSGDMHGISDVEDVGKRLAESSIRTLRSREYLIGRRPL